MLPCEHPVNLSAVIFNWYVPALLKVEVVRLKLELLSEYCDLANELPVLLVTEYHAPDVTFEIA
jgi:hypothetical protein